MQLLQCPTCGWIGEAYNSQIEGKDSCVCFNCGMHFYSNRTPFKIRTLPIIDIERFMPEHPRYSPFYRLYKY